MSEQPSDLERIRKEITELDQSLLALLAKRRELSLEVAKDKLRSERPVRDESREQALLVSLIQRAQVFELDAPYVTRVFQTIIEDSVRFQQAWLQQQANPRQQALVRVAYLGSKGSYSQLATHSYFSRYPYELADIGCNSFDQILSQVEKGHADYGVLPIENTSSGGINEVYDLLMHTNLTIVGEITHPVEHQLLTVDDTELDKIRTIYTHPQPYAQCSQFLSELEGVRIEYTDSTTSALQKVSELQDPTVAAIGSPAGGRSLGLHVLHSGLANQQENHSRFIVVARKAVTVAPQIPAKTTFIMAVAQQPGALVEALLVLRDQGISMCKLESRPMPGNPWEELFYVDVEANLASTAMQSALDQLIRSTRYLKVLGCYPAAEVRPVAIRTEAKEYLSKNIE